MLRTKLIQSIQFLYKLIIFLLIFLNLTLVKTFYLLLIFCVKRLNLLYYKGLLIFKLSNLRSDSVEQMLYFVTFQIFEDEAEIRYIRLGRITYFKPFDNKER